MKFVKLIVIDELTGSYHMNSAKGFEEDTRVCQWEGKSETTFFQYYDFSQCQTMNDLLDLLLETQSDAIVFFYNAYNYKLLNTIFEQYVEYGECEKFFFISDKVGEPVRLEGRNITICSDCDQMYHYMEQPSLAVAKEASYWESICLQYQSEKVVVEGDYQVRMRNGYNLLFTGKYPNDFLMSKAHHIYVEEPSVLESLNLQEYMDINSAVFLDEDKMGERVRGFVENYYVHVHTLSEDLVKYDFSQTTDKITKIPYSCFLDRNPEKSNDDLEYVYMKEREDYDAFRHDLDLFRDSGVVRNPFFLLQNECRWANRCSFQYQRRLALTKDLQVIPCMDCSQPIYSILEDEYEKSTIRSRMADQMQIECKCKTCAAKNRCTKCICLPDGMAREQYCEINRTYSNIAEFFNAKNALLLLIQCSSVFQNANYQELHFSNSMHLLQLPEIYRSGKEDESNCYLFEYAGKYFCFNPFKNRIIKLNEGFVMLLEAKKQGYGEERIFQIMQEKYGEQITIDTCRALLEQLKQQIM